MPKVKFENGVTVNFTSMPSQADIDEVAKKFGGSSSSKPQDKPYTYGDATYDTGKTIVQSAGNTIGNIIYPIRHPIQAAKGMASAVAHPIQTAKAIGQYAGERYGSMDKLANTVSTDPFGFVGDVYGAAGVAGGFRPKNFPATIKGAQVAGETALGTAVNVGQGAKNVVTAPYRYVKDIIQTPAKAKKLADEALFNIEQNTRAQAHSLNKAADMKQSVVAKNYASTEKSYADLEKVLDFSAQKAGYKEALALQKELPKHFAAMSSKFGSRLNELIKGQDITIPAQGVVQSLESALVDKGVLRFDPETKALSVAASPRTPAESKIYNAYVNAKNLMDSNPEAVFDATDLIRTNNIIKPKYGKKWTPDEYMQARVVEKLSQHINDAVPGIQALKTEFRPYLQWKDRVINKLEPFAGERNASKAGSLISKAGTQELSFDDRRMLGELEKQLGRDVGGKVKALRQGQAIAASKRAMIKDEAAKVLSDLKSRTADEVFNLRQQKNISKRAINDSVDKILAEYGHKRVIAGAAGAVVSAPLMSRAFIKYFLRREMFQALHGRAL